MRRIILIAAAALLTQAGIAQVEFGLKGGIAFNSVRSEGQNPVELDKGSLGCTFGAALTVSASKNFAVQPELNFISLRAKDNIKNFKYRYSFITFPVLLKYKVSNSGVGIYAGPQLAFLTGANYKNGSQKFDQKDVFTNTDVAGLLGIDFRLPQGLWLDLRLQRSYTNLIKIEDNSPNKTRATIVTFTVGHVFHSKKKQ